MAVTVSDGSLCGFCQSGHHNRCAIGVKYTGDQPHAKYPEGIVWRCNCPICQNEAKGKMKCARCNNTKTEEINPETWECLDTEACHSTVQRRLDNNPLIQQLREIKERVDMAKATESKAKAEKAAKAPKEPTFCVCCGEPTKGGKFLPGHDARYVSTLVEAVTSKNQTKAQAVKTLKDAGASDALQAKFEKSHALAVAKAEKAAAAEKEKKATKASKK